MDDFYDFIYETPQQPAQSTAPEICASPAPKRERKQHGNRMGVRIIAIALVCSLLGGAAGAAAVWFAVGKTEGAGQTQATANALVSTREQAELNLLRVENGTLLTPSELYAKNVNATVGITAQVTTGSYFGSSYFGSSGTATSAGSGFILTDNGYILTNYHVVEDANAITVTLYSGEQYHATLVGSDSDNDIAVLKIEASGLSTVIIGDSDTLNVGDSVVAIGNPLGELTFSLTCGVVSALEREITLSRSSTMTLIQTDCAINAGNSGGALFNLYGEVIGITNAKYSSSSSSEASIDNIGFAIPINTAMKIAQSIIENGYYAKPFIGVTVTNATTEDGTVIGAKITDVTAGGPADQAGLQIDDIVTAVDGVAVTGSKALARLIADCDSGDLLVFSVLRNGKTIELKVTVGERTQESIEQESSNQQSIFPWG